MAELLGRWWCVYRDGRLGEEGGVFRLETDVSCFANITHQDGGWVTDSLAHPEKCGEHLGEAAFADCRQLTRFFVPRSVSKIDDRCFEGCTELTEMKIPRETDVGDDIFRGCTKLRRVELPMKLKQDSIREKLGLPEHTQIIWS